MFPQVPEAEEAQHGSGAGRGRGWERAGRNASNGGGSGGRGPEGSPKPASERTGEQDVIGVLRGSGTDGTCTVLRLEDVLLHKVCAAVDPLLNHEPREETDLGQTVVVPDELGVLGENATK